MSRQAFVLNSEFMSEVWEKVESLKQSLTEDKEFAHFVKEWSSFSQEHLTTIVETAYWVSHTTEEQKPSNVSLVLSAPEEKWHTYRFDNPVPVSKKHLVKIGSALDSGFSDICLWPDDNGVLHIWGFKMRSVNHLTTSPRVLILRPGCIVIMCYGRSIAALTGNKGNFLNPEFLFTTFLPSISLGGGDSELKIQQFLDFSTLLQICQAMRLHSEGGTLLIVPKESSWEKSVKQPVTYSGRARFFDNEGENIPTPVRPVARRNPGDLLKMFTDPENKLIAEYRLKIVEQSNRIGRLTAADGALVMSDDRYVRCFGAKIEAIDALRGSTEIRVLRPIEGDKETIELLADLGGTRHQSAAQFVHDQPEAIAVVASQDGSVTFFSKESSSGNLLAVRDADLVLMHEGIIGAFWNLHRLLDRQLSEM